MTSEGKVAWTVREWCAAVSLSRPYVHKLIRDDQISSVKSGTRRLITTPPDEYMRQLGQQRVTYTKRGRPVKQVA